MAWIYKEKPICNQAESREFSPPVSLLLLCLTATLGRQCNTLVTPWLCRWQEGGTRIKQTGDKKAQFKKKGGRKMKAEWWIEHREGLLCRRKNIKAQIHGWNETAPASTRPSLEMQYQRENIKFCSCLGRVAKDGFQMKEIKSMKHFLLCWCRR